MESRKIKLLEQLQLTEEESWIYIGDDCDNEGQKVILTDAGEWENNLLCTYGIYPLFNSLNFFPYWCELLRSNPTFLNILLTNDEKTLNNQVWKKFENEVIVLDTYFVHKPTLTIMMRARIEKKELDQYKHLRIEPKQQFTFPFSVAEWVENFPSLASLVPSILTDDEKPKEELNPVGSNINELKIKVKTEEVQEVLNNNLSVLASVDAVTEFVEVKIDEVTVGENGLIDLNNNNVVPVYDIKIPVPPPVVSPTNCKDLMVRDVDGDKHKMLARSLWSKFGRDVELTSRSNAAVLAKLLKSDPVLSQTLIEYLNKNYLATMLSTIADPYFKSEDNIFDYISNANTYSAAINRAPGCWSVFDGATWMLSPNEYNMLSYSFTKVVNLDKNWEYTKEKPKPKTKQYLVSHYFECPNSSGNVHLLPYVKNNYAYLWVQAAGYFQKKLDKLINNVLPSPGIALLNLPNSALNCECFDAYRIKRDKENAQKLSVHMRGRLPKTSIPMRLKNDLKSFVYPNYTAFMQGSDGSYIANLLILDEFAAYKDLYMEELRTARENASVIFYGKLFNSVLSFRENGLPAITDSVDVVQSSKWIEQVQVPVDFIFQNQGYIKAVCFKNYYLHDYAWAIRHLIRKICGRVTVVGHDNCLFLYPLDWNVEDIDISTLVPVVGNEDNSLSDGCSQDKKLVSKLVQHFKHKNDGVNVEVYFRSKFLSSKGKWKEDVVGLTALFLKRLNKSSATYFTHPVPWDFYLLLKDKKALDLLMRWKIRIVLLPCPPSYYCPLVIFTKGKSTLKELEVSARKIALASAVLLKLLNIQFFHDTSVLHFNSAQNENLREAHASIMSQVEAFFPVTRLRGNAYIPSPKEDVDSFERYAETATEVGEEIDMNLFAQDTFFKM